MTPLGRRQEQYLLSCLRSFENGEEARTYWGKSAERLAESLVKRGLIEPGSFTWGDGSVQKGHKITPAGIEVAKVIRVKKTLAGGKL